MIKTLRGNKKMKCVCQYCKEEMSFVSDFEGSDHVCSNNKCELYLVR